MYVLQNVVISRYFLLLERLPGTLVPVRSDASLPPNARGEKLLCKLKRCQSLFTCFDACRGVISGN